MPAVMRDLHARDSERSRAVLKFGQMLETPSILRYDLSCRFDGDSGRDNATGAANQQERLDAYRSDHDEEACTSRQVRSWAPSSEFASEHLSANASRP